MIYVFLADGFEEIEALATVDILRRADIDTKTVGVTGKTVMGTHGIKVEADIRIDEATDVSLDGVVLPGGLPGAWNLKDNQRVRELTEYCFKTKKLVAAICAAPAVLGDFGFLKGKKAVCYPGFEDRLVGAQCVSDSVVVSDNIITAKGAGAAFEFAFEIVSYVEGSDKKAKTIGDAMQCVR